jgi:NTP pyrophosphatase (non-canonical NTP hydrolase)
MSDDEEMVMFSGRIPKSLKQLIDADQRTNQQVLQSALWDEFGGERVGDIENKLKEKQSRKQTLEQGIGWRSEELDDVEQEIEALERKKKRLETDKEELWQEALDVVTIANGEIIDGEKYLSHHASNLGITVKELRQGLVERYNE